MRCQNLELLHVLVDNGNDIEKGHFSVTTGQTFNLNLDLVFLLQDEKQRVWLTNFSLVVFIDLID